MNTPTDLMYTKDHEWIRVEGDLLTIGVTDFAQSEMGDVVFVELPEVGATVNAGKQLAVVESVKAVSDVFSPVSGTVEEVNQELDSTPELINEDCYGAAWIAKVKIADTKALDNMMSADEYKEYIEE